MWCSGNSKSFHNDKKLSTSRKLVFLPRIRNLATLYDKKRYFIRFIHDEIQSKLQKLDDRCATSAIFWTEEERETCEKESNFLTKSNQSSREVFCDTRILLSSTFSETVELMTPRANLQKMLKIPKRETPTCNKPVQTHTKH